MFKEATLWKKTACILCSENCGLEVQVEEGRLIKIRGDKDHPDSKGYLCQKAARLDYYQNHEDRLDSPLARQTDGSFKRISWDQAIQEIADKFKRIRDQYGGKTIAYYGGGGQGNHLGGVYGASFRAALQTPFFYSSLAQEKTGDFWVNGKLFGRQTCHVTSSVEDAQVVLFLGTNPFQSHGFPRARKVLKELQADPTRTMIVVDPRRTETTKMADIHLPVRPGCDAFLLSAILAILVEEGLTDESFLEKHCTGQKQVITTLKALPISEYIAHCGLKEEDVRNVAKILGGAKSATIRADLGLQQSLHSTLNSYLEKLLFLLTGNFGRAGTNNLHSFLLPLMGHSPEIDEGNSNRTAVANMQAIGKLYPPNILPQEILTDHPEHIRALFVNSANPLLSAADTTAYQKACQALDLLVVVDVAMTETATLADYVLPASSQFEKMEATFFSLNFPSNGFHLRHPILPALPGTLTEPEIYRRLCVAMGELPDHFPLLEAAANQSCRKSFSRALEAFFQLQPELRKMSALVLYATLGKSLGKEKQSAAVLWGASHMFAKRYEKAVRRTGIDGEDLGESLFQKILRSPSGMHFSQHLYEECFTFVRTDDHKIHLDIPPLLSQLEALEDPLQKDATFPFILMAGERRSYNATTICRDPNWRKNDHEGALLMNSSDAHSLDFEDGQRVRIHSRTGQIVAHLTITDTVPRGVLSIPHGYGISHPREKKRVQIGPRINQLTCSDYCDPMTKTPYHKNLQVRVEALSKESRTKKNLLKQR